MMPDDVRKSAFAMPLRSPSYPIGPYRFVDREYMIITYRTDREALERIVPEPLEIDDPIVRYEFIRVPHSTGFGSYAGSTQIVPVRFSGETGGYTHAMFLDAHPPISGGRELWGFPQELATPSLKVERDTLVGTRDDRRMLRLHDAQCNMQHEQTVSSVNRHVKRLPQARVKAIMPSVS